MSDDFVLDAFPDYDENGHIKGFIEKSTIQFFEKNDPEAEKFFIKKEDTPCIVLLEFDREGSEFAKEPITKHVGNGIKLTDEQANFFIEVKRSLLKKNNFVYKGGF